MAFISLRQLLDHAAEHHCGVPAVCQQSIRSGFSSVMMDGSGEAGSSPARPPATSLPSNALRQLVPLEKMIARYAH